RSSILYVNQKPVMFRGSVRENIFKPFELRLNKDRMPENASVVTLLRKLYLSNSVLERDAMTLSVGEAARICLVRALLLSPDILLLDEPTASLDLDSRKAVAKTLNEWLSLTDSGIIGVTHDETLTEMAPGLEIHLGSY
ncbi:MAG: ATP-binding cassette domain-containing protein, partial [Desulfomonilaceae bacterium]